MVVPEDCNKLTAAHGKNYLRESSFFTLINLVLPNETCLVCISPKRNGGCCKDRSSLIQRPMQHLTYFPVCHIPEEMHIFFSLPLVCPSVLFQRRTRGKQVQKVQQDQFHCLWVSATLPCSPLLSPLPHASRRCKAAPVVWRNRSKDQQFIAAHYGQG